MTSHSIRFSFGFDGSGPMVSQCAICVEQGDDSTTIFCFECEKRVCSNCCSDHSTDVRIVTLLTQEQVPLVACPNGLYEFCTLCGDLFAEADSQYPDAADFGIPSAYSLPFEPVCEACYPAWLTKCYETYRRNCRLAFLVGVLDTASSVGRAARRSDFDVNALALALELVDDEARAVLPRQAQRAAPRATYSSRPLKRARQS